MTSKTKKDARGFREIRNSKVGHKYTIGDKFEAGVMLQGTEVKSIRAGKAQISESFVRIERGNAVLYHAHIEEYAFGGSDQHNPLRPRRLLLHRKEIEKIRIALEQGGFSCIPLRLYFKGSLVKLEIAVCKGKKMEDKREDLRKKAAMREADRYFKDNRR